MMIAMYPNDAPVLESNPERLAFKRKMFLKILSHYMVLVLVMFMMSMAVFLLPKSQISGILLLIVTLIGIAVLLTTNFIDAGNRVAKVYENGLTSINRPLFYILQRNDYFISLEIMEWVNIVLGTENNGTIQVKIHDKNKIVSVLEEFTGSSFFNEFIKYVQQEPKWKAKLKDIDTSNLEPTPIEIDEELQALASGVYKSKLAAVIALGYSNDPRVVDPLIHLLQEKDSQTKKYTAQSLGNLGDKRAVEPLLKLLSDLDWQVRMKAVEALGKIGNPKAIGGVGYLLCDKNYKVRWAVVKALARFEDEQKTQYIERALEDKSWFVRREAAIHLGSIQQNRSVEALIRALGDKKPNVRWAAVQSLSKIGNKMAIEPLRRVAHKDGKTAIKRAAKEAINTIINQNKRI